ncbi:Oidioi.mRNA.OKI2018_I69.chr2.g6444.t1.cds [Oikopleura dioica]|uniref:Oidioi.mRNA.OKI2018_I69.chr2.g6444.t1.cds n=1 Tax=Oikopleura dioica TaxID=34765 RepID=A0ABN7T978_OIKDI|nr:Oidioi.mRNA.OKI2018_I69.chr2.g6444.t1.cds [Oikopleura dioica]
MDTPHFLANSPVSNMCSHSRCQINRQIRDIWDQNRCSAFALTVKKRECLLLKKIQVLETILVLSDASSSDVSSAAASFLTASTI